MIIERLVLPPLDNNTYVLSNNGYCLIVDPSSSEDIIEEKLKGKELVGILVTHYHFDHIGSLEYFKKKYNVNVYDFNTIGKQRVKNFNFEVISTKGHSKDSVSFYFKDSKDMFVGDFIFYETIGRTDLVGSDEEDMAYSLSFLRRMDSSIKIYPGHGYTTTLQHELECNPYL